MRDPQFKLPYNTPEEAYDWAMRYNRCVYSRKVASQDPGFSFIYAKIIDRGFHSMTFRGVSSDGHYLKRYIEEIMLKTYDWSLKEFV